MIFELLSRYSEKPLTGWLIKFLGWDSKLLFFIYPGNRGQIKLESWAETFSLKVSFVRICIAYFSFICYHIIDMRLQRFCWSLRQAANKSSILRRLNQSSKIKKVAQYAGKKTIRKFSDIEQKYNDNIKTVKKLRFRKKQIVSIY